MASGPYWAGLGEAEGPRESANPRKPASARPPALEERNKCEMVAWRGYWMKGDGKVESEAREDVNIDSMTVSAKTEKVRRISGLDVKVELDIQLLLCLT